MLTITDVITQYIGSSEVTFLYIYGYTSSITISSAVDSSQINIQKRVTNGTNGTNPFRKHYSINCTATPQNFEAIRIIRKTLL